MGIKWAKVLLFYKEKFKEMRKRSKNKWFKGQEKVKPRFLGAMNLLRKIRIVL